MISTSFYFFNPSIIYHLRLSLKVKVKLLSHVTPWTVAYQAPPSMGFSRQEYWSGLPFPPLGDLPDPGIEPVSPASLALQVDSLSLSHQGSPRLSLFICKYLTEYN